MATTEDQRRLLTVQEQLAALTAEQQRLEGERDKLLAKLLDNTGAHDQRHVGAR